MKKSDMKKPERDRYDEMKHDLQGGQRQSQEFLSEEPAVLEGGPGVVSRGVLGGMRVAVLIADGFEQSEFDGPVAALQQEGALVEVLAPDDKHRTHIQGVHHQDPAPGATPSRLLADASPEEFDALFVPGGLKSPDTMRQSQMHLDFVKAFLQAEKPVAMICHGPWLLADADGAPHRTVTSWPAIRRDLERAGATWVDQEVVVDGNLVTSRKPDDVPAFSRAVVQLLVATKRSQ